MFFDILYNIIIYPIEFIIEIIFYLFNIVFKSSYGVSLFFLSLSVSILSLPLYIVAEKWKKEEKKIQDRMKPDIEHIKKTFKGDEKFLLMQACYKIYGYKTIYAFRGTLGLLIQIPFFIAAYNFIHSLSSLDGVSFLFIKDLSKPDNLIHIGNISINLLPFLMTLFSLLSGLVYSKKGNFKENISIYIIPIIFLILLYTSPSGLLFYWTLNCFFSLIKNLIIKYKFNIKNLIIKYRFNTSKTITNSKYFLVKNTKSIKFFRKNLIDLVFSIKEKRIKLFVISCLVISILSGLFIPSSLISSSSYEFSSPFYLIINNLSMSIGLFLFYPLFIYILSPEKIKNYISLLSIFIVFIIMLNTFIMVGNYVNINSNFIFDNTDLLIASNKEVLINFIIIILVSCIVFFILKNTKSIIINVLLIVLLALISVSMFNINKISNEHRKLNLNAVNNDNNDKIFNISKTGNNIFLFVLDRAISSYWVDAFKRHPEYVDKLDGFEFYKNNVSLGGSTTAIAHVFGGYDYSPYVLSTNGSYILKEKHNEALLNIPLSLSKYGYESAILGPIYSDFEYSDSLGKKIFLEYTNIHAYTRNYLMDDALLEFNGINKNIQFSHNKISFRFSIFRMLPINFRHFFYNNKSWFFNKLSINTSISSYASLLYTKKVININDTGNYYNVIYNLTTHEPQFFNSDYYPHLKTDYINKSDLSIYKDEFSTRHFYANAASINFLIDFIEFLKANNVYDNTKIILVSDHGAGLNSTVFSNTMQTVYNALLMYKDFNSRGELKIETNFTTSADVAYLATKHIPDIRNPFNNNIITNDYKYDGVYMVDLGSTWRLEEQYSNRYNFKNTFYVKDDIFNTNNWKKFEIDWDTKKLEEVDF